MSDDRETLSVRRKQSRQQRRASQAQSDWVHLAAQPQFLRTLFTIFDTVGMYTGNFHPDGRIHAMSEGRRSVGLDILRTAERYLGPDAHLRVLEAEKQTLTEAPNDRSGTEPGNSLR